MSDIKRIGAFFDGTGNHKENDKRINDGSISNIGKLHKAYIGVEKFYVEGVGTRLLNKTEVELVKQGIKEKNDFYDSSAMAFGIGTKAKVNEMLKEVKPFIKENPTSEIVIDVFGFSRGSTEARDFINEINTLYANNSNIKIGIVGLYDTVATVGLSNEYNENLNLDLNENSAKKVIHLTAKDETRFNFSLETLKDKNGNLPANFIELEVAGAHADVGGGYKTYEKEYYKEESKFIKYTHELDKENQINNIKQEALENGFEIHNINEVSNGILSYDIMNVREVQNGLSNVYLNLMTEKLISSGVPIDKSILYDSSVSNDLKDYYNALLNKNSASLSSELINKYIHNSDTKERSAKNLSDALANFEELNGQRDIYTNNPENAVAVFNKEISFDSNDNSITYKDENGNTQQLTYNEDNDLLIYGDLSNPDKITFTDEKGDYQVWEKDENGNYVRTNTADYSIVGKTAINQIGSLIIANNSDFSNIDKIVVGTSVGVVADLATYNKDIAVDDVGASSWKNLAGSVVSFALSSYFAKNDNISDILGMDGTFIGDLADFTLSYAASTSVTNFATGKSINFDFYSAIGGFIGSKIGYAIADSWIDTKEESIGASVGSAIGAMAGAKIGAEMGSWGGPIGALIGAIIGVIVGSLLGGLFGGTPPPPTAEAKLEFDEETQTYNLVFSDSDDGGNEEAMINIGNSFAQQLTNIFNLPGGQLVDASLMPDININQFKKKIFINGYKGSFSTAKETMAHALSVEIPFINVENGNAYVLRAMHRTNEKFLEGDPDAESGRVDLDLLYKNIKIAQEYSDYKNEVNIIIDSNGKIITDKKILQEINEEYLQISKVENETEKNRLLDEFSKKYSFKNYKVYVDEILEEVTKEDIQNYYIEKKRLEKSFDKKIEEIEVSKILKINGIINKAEKLAVLEQIKEEKAIAILKLNEKYYKEIEAIHWQEVFSLVEELKLEEQHYSEDYNKLNSEIAKYNYEIHKENKELLDINIDEYLKQIAKRMMNIYQKEDALALNKSVEANINEVSKKEALAILKELGYDLNLGYLNYKNSLDINVKAQAYEEFLKNSKILKYSFLGKVEISAKRFEELLELANIQNPYENFTINEDAFSFAGKSLNDLQFELKEGKLIITTFDKDLEAQKAQENSKEFVISNWKKWDKTNTYIELPNGTKVNLQALLNLIKVKENGGKIDVSEAFKTLLLEDKELAKYVKEFEDKNIYLDTSLDDKITAYYGNNLIVSIKGNDTIVTGSGNDFIIVQDGKKNIDTGLGNDTVSYEKSKSGVYVSLNSDNNSDTLKNVENLKGSKFDDILVGDNKNNTLKGNSGNDILEGKGGSDTLDGGEGVDLVDYTNSENSSVVNLKNNYSNENDKYINIEGVKGSRNDDVIVTNDENNIVFANNGADNISLGNGNDIVYAGKGDDYIVSTSGDNKVYTGEGDDVVILGDGNDYINTTAGKNIIYAGSGKDTVEYKDKFENYQIMFLNNNTILIKSNDKKVLDTLVDIEEIAFKNAVFEVDFKNKQLIKKAEFKNEEEIVDEENKNIQIPENRASSIATAIMIGTVAAAETKESSSDEISYFNDEAVLDLKATNNQEPIFIPIVEANTSLYKDILLIKEYKKQNLKQESMEDSLSSINRNDNSLLTKSNLPLVEKNSSTQTTLNISAFEDEKTLQKRNIQEELQTNIETKTIKKLNPLISALVKLNKTIINEDEIFFDFDISNPNTDSFLEVIFEGIPNGFNLSSGEKRADGNWYLKQNDLINLKLFPQENNSDDFEITIKAIVLDKKGRIIDTQLSEKITIIAVADTPNLSLDTNEKEILEDTILPININSSLVDTLDGVDGKERLLISLENIPNDAALNRGKKDSSGIWYLKKDELKGLELTTKLHSDEDFIIKVTAYAIESENNSISSISETLKVEVNAVADAPILELSDAKGNEDTPINLDIKSALIDTDGSEVLSIKIENVPSDAILNKGEKDEFGVWNLKPKDLNFLTITPKAHDATDFTIKVIALTKENENNSIAQISKELEVKVDAVADKVKLNLFQETTSGMDAVVSVMEDPGFAYIDIASEFIDKDGSERLYYLIEGLPQGTSLTAGEVQSDGSWKVLPTQLEELSINLVENSDENFTLKVTAVTTEKENGHQEFTSKEVEVRIESEADFANLEVSNTKGYQNSFIPLDIKSSLTDTDGSETLEIVIQQVPPNAVLNKGNKDSKGNWHLKVEELEGLQIRPEFNSIKDFELKVKAITTEKKNGNKEESVAYIKVDVQTIPASVNVTVNPVKANEDEVATLDIRVNTRNLRASQDFYLELKLPSEFSLNTGEKLNNTTWKVSTKNLDNLQLYSPLNYSGNFNIGITSVVVEPDKTLTRSKVEVNLPVEIAPVADKAILNVNNITANEDDLIFLNLSSKLQDLDGSETLKLQIKGLPDNIQLNTGEKKGDIWIVDEKDIKKLAFIAPENFSGTLNLQIKSISEDKGISRTEVSKTLSININEVIEQPILKVQNSFIKDNQASIYIDTSLVDNDGSETLSLLISNLPSGSSLNKGVLNKDGSYTLKKEDLEDLIIKDILNNDNLCLNIKAISSANGNKEEVEKKINLTALDSDFPYFNINKVQLSSSTVSSQTLNYTDANDSINSGGANDKIYSKGGDDTIYADSIAENTKALIELNIDKSSLSTNELIVLQVENLPSNTTSNKGFFKEGSLYINTQDFDGKIVLSYASKGNENLKLKVVAHIVNENDINTILKSSSLDISLENSELAGNDYIDSSKGNDTIYAQDNNDIILAKQGNDTIFAGNGDDYIEGGSGADKIDAGKGNDTIVVDYDDFQSKNLLVEVINGGDGNDTVIVDDTRGINFDMGLTNIEKFIGSEGNDNIIGSNGNDIIRGNKGVDTYFTKGGDDIAYIDASDLKSQSGDFINMGSGYDKIYIDDTKDIVFDITSTNAEKIILGTGNSVIKNNANREITILGGRGNDTIYASRGKDILDGGKGNDTIDYSNSNQGININLNTNTVSRSYATNDIISNFENVVGTAYDDNIIGNNLSNIFYATKGNDNIDGKAGNDTVVYNGKLIEYFNGKEVKNIITNFNSNASVITQTGINELKNISTLQFNDFKVYLDDVKKNSAFTFDDKVFTTEDKALNITSQNLLLNDFSIKSNDTLKIVGIKNSLNGTAILNKDGTIKFNPDKNYNSSIDNTFDRNSALYKGKAGFEYIVEDKDKNQSSAFVEVNVQAVNDAPNLISSYFNRNSLNTGKGKIVVDDVDSNIDSLNVSIVSSLAFVTSFYRGEKCYALNVSGVTNINGRSIEKDGEFNFDYSGSYWKKKGDRVFEMKSFVVKISDEGDFLTGENIKNLFVHTGTNFHYVKRDPIVLDLDGDGVEFVQKYYEKHNEILDGVSKDDAVLVWDYNKDETISSQLETDWRVLFDNATNDIEALKGFDTNKDAIFDKNDKEWENFALWQDKNEDGIVSQDEFIKIEKSNIEKINLTIDLTKEKEELIEAYATYETKDNEVRDLVATYIDTTMTEDKMSEEDMLILKQAIKLTEELASKANIGTENNIVENIDNEEETIYENEIF